MNRYICYCTEEQTRKAIELGAPIQEHPFEPSIIKANEKMFHHIVCIRDRYYCLPTTEQMLCWLEETYDLHINIDYRRDYANDADGNIVDEWYYYCFFLSIADKCFYGEDTLDEYSSHKEATIAAIDTALDYLLTTKEK